jgi:hypothetical protein
MSAPQAHYTRDALAHAPTRVRWWPAVLGLILVGIIYALVSTPLVVGPPGALLILAVIIALGARVMRWRGMVHVGRLIAIAGLGVISAAVTVSAVYLVGALLSRATEAVPLLRDAGLLWVSNLLTFSLWYWEIDGGGPAHRHATGCGSTDFGFPQNLIGGETTKGWMPEYVDYVFLAFNTSTAFSPTDTVVFARRSKVLMMWQSLVSLITIAVIAARAINTI